MKQYFIPESVSIFHQTFQVQQVDGIDKYQNDFTLGKVVFQENVILIDSHLPEDRKMQVLLHEIVHAIFDLTGQTDACSNESLVQSTATALYSLLMENTPLQRPAEW